MKGWEKSSASSSSEGKSCLPETLKEQQESEPSESESERMLSDAQEVPAPVPAMAEVRRIGGLLARRGGR